VIQQQESCQFIFKLNSALVNFKRHGIVMHRPLFKILHRLPALVCSLLWSIYRNWKFNVLGVWSLQR
jgi:hypothetical protein